MRPMLLGVLLATACQTEADLQTQSFAVDQAPPPVVLFSDLIAGDAFSVTVTGLPPATEFGFRVGLGTGPVGSSTLLGSDLLIAGPSLARTAEVDAARFGTVDVPIPANAPPTGTPIYVQLAALLPNGARLRSPVTVFALNCGDGIVEGIEECDDGGLENGDGCNNFCACEGACASDDVVFSELLINASGPDDGSEFVELLGPPSSSADGFFIAVIEGDAPGTGIVDKVFDLTGMSFGSNGLLLLRDSALYANPVPLPGTNVQTLPAAFDPDLENGSTTYFLAQGTPPVVGQDLDADDDGLLDPGVFDTVLVRDAITLLSGTPGSLGYADQFGGAVIDAAFLGFTPGAIKGLFNSDRSRCSAVAGVVTGTVPGPITYDPLQSFGLAENGLVSVRVDPGVPNEQPDSDGDGLLDACDPTP